MSVDATILHADDLSVGESEKVKCTERLPVQKYDNTKRTTSGASVNDTVAEKYVEKKYHA